MYNFRDFLRKQIADADAHKQKEAEILGGGRCRSVDGAGFIGEKNSFGDLASSSSFANVSPKRDSFSWRTSFFGETLANVEYKRAADAEAHKRAADAEAHKRAADAEAHKEILGRCPHVVDVLVEEEDRDMKNTEELSSSSTRTGPAVERSSSKSSTTFRPLLEDLSTVPTSGQNCSLFQQFCPLVGGAPPPLQHSAENLTEKNSLESSPSDEPELPHFSALTKTLQQIQERLSSGLSGVIHQKGPLFLESDPLRQVYYAQQLHPTTTNSPRPPASPPQRQKSTQQHDPTPLSSATPLLSPHDAQLRAFVHWSLFDSIPAVGVELHRPAIWNTNPDTGLVQVALSEQEESCRRLRYQYFPWGLPVAPAIGSAAFAKLRLPGKYLFAAASDALLAVGAAGGGRGVTDQLARQEEIRAAAHAEWETKREVGWEEFRRFCRRNGGGGGGFWWWWWW